MPLIAKITKFSTKSNINVWYIPGWLWLTYFMQVWKKLSSTKTCYNKENRQKPNKLNALFVINFFCVCVCDLRCVCLYLLRYVHFHALQLSFAHARHMSVSHNASNNNNSFLSLISSKIWYHMMCMHVCEHAWTINEQHIRKGRSRCSHPLHRM